MFLFNSDGNGEPDNEWLDLPSRTREHFRIRSPRAGLVGRTTMVSTWGSGSGVLLVSRLAAVRHKAMSSNRRQLRFRLM